MKVKDSICGKTISLDEVYATIEHGRAIHCFCSRKCWQQFVDEHTCARPCRLRLARLEARPSPALAYVLFGRRSRPPTMR